jgi:TRAP-type C4-dicarboxylate transport system permease large subunit
VLTAVLFALVLIVTRQSPLSVAPVREALPEMGKRMKPLGRYVFVAVVVLGLCYLLLDQTLDEHTAPTLLPLVLFGFLFVERGARALTPPATPPVREATDETTGHIGALLLLMSLSIALGGAIERSEIILMMPSDLGSPFLTMGLLVVVLIIIGMTMDPYGAVIVVSATIADVAYKNGIDVSHFWLTVLTAFELGYLSPPVALNQLLTRQVVGGAEVDRVMAQATGSWWRRNEATLLPVTVMGIALLIVAFVPLFFTAA